MWVRQREPYSMYKRASSRDYMNTTDMESKEFVDTLDMEDNSALLQKSMVPELSNPSWRLSLPHVLVATISSFLFGYHLGVVNEPLESISADLGFKGNALAEGLVVSTCLGGAFLGSLFSGWIADGVGRRRAFQLCALPMIIGAVMSATAKTLAGMLIGRLFVGTGMGLGPPVASLYVTEVSPSFVRGTYGSFIQIATCLGLMGALLVGIPVKEIAGWWRVCFWVSTIPAAILALAMVFCAESPHWLHKQGRTYEAEAAFEKLLGGSHVKTAMVQLNKVDSGDETDAAVMELLWHGNGNGCSSSCSKFLFFRLWVTVPICWWNADVCLNICPRSRTSSRSPFTRNISRSHQGKSNGCLYVSALGDKFLRGFAVLATIRKSWPTASVFYVWYRLHDGCGFCETECGGN
ncbi:probable plastidic glucose transporter 2 isoform X2 [Rosa chinensis]|uniref:probable plastidic glucose transporter 2 isoform X2 n=1 Tax=Rosa chinensis TaxID=74649 RepID=UPI001AD93787|nr:probable plastidic glucose transporter 2 isoform X2 [Rosa chinensis]